MFIEITLDQLLQSRDNRHLRQMELLAAYPEDTLLCLTVIMPGAVKRNHLSLKVAHRAVEATKEAFLPHDIKYSEERDLPTGYEAFFVVGATHSEAKSVACHIEDTHIYGRLIDIDVIKPSGEPMSRQEIGNSPRRCLVCNNEARYCMRNHSHSQEEILEAVKSIVT